VAAALEEAQQEYQARACQFMLMTFRSGGIIAAMGESCWRAHPLGSVVCGAPPLRLYRGSPLSPPRQAAEDKQREAGQLERRVKQLKSEVGLISGMIDWQIRALRCCDVLCYAISSAPTAASQPPLCTCCTGRPLRLARLLPCSTPDAAIPCVPVSPTGAGLPACEAGGCKGRPS